MKNFGGHADVPGDDLLDLSEGCVFRLQGGAKFVIEGGQAGDGAQARDDGGQRLVAKEIAGEEGLAETLLQFLDVTGLGEELVSGLDGPQDCLLL